MGVSASRPVRFIPQGKNAQYTLDRRWVYPRSCPDAAEKTKIPAPSETRTPGQPTRSIGDWALQVQLTHPNHVLLSHDPRLATQAILWIYKTQNVRVKLSQHWNKHCRVGLEVQLHAFLTSISETGQWLAWRLACFSPEERVPGFYQTGTWEDPGTRLDTVKKMSVPLFTGNRTFSPVVIFAAWWTCEGQTQMWNAYRIFTRKPGVQRQTTRCGVYRLKDNIKNLNTKMTLWIVLV
jgi:hypothetical protein